MEIMATNGEVYEHLQSMQDATTETVVSKFVEKYLAFQRVVASKDSPNYRQSCLSLYKKMQRVQKKVKDLKRRGNQEAKDKFWGDLFAVPECQRPGATVTRPNSESQVQVNTRPNV